LFLELNKLNDLSKGDLHKTPIYITHIKPCMDCETKIKQELIQENKIGCALIYPEQGKEIMLDK
jgi:hypothetical protein